MHNQNIFAYEIVTQGVPSDFLFMPVTRNLLHLLINLNITVLNIVFYVKLGTLKRDSMS